MSGMQWMVSVALAVALAGCGSVKTTAGAEPGGTDAGRVSDAWPVGFDGTSGEAAVVDAPRSADVPTAGVVARDNGAACSGEGQCASGFCVDGTCCATACKGPCEACDVAGAAGSCLAVAGAPHGARQCLGQGTPCAGRCAGVETSTCAYPGSDTTCAAASCTAGVAVTRSVCSGGGACLPGTRVTCAPYPCAGDVCAGGCTPDHPCTPGNYCNGGRCNPQQPNGAACQDAAGCASSACVDGHCCAIPSCGSCSACTGAMGSCQKVTGAPDPDSCASPSACDSSGACKKPSGSACARDGDCLSGFCVDKVCCNSVCNGPCQSCKLPGSAGTCGTPSFATDPRNCGGCGHACSSNHVAAVCGGGQCAGACEPGFQDCNMDRATDGCEVDTRSDPASCGGCGMTCPGTRCLAASCEKIQFTWSFTGPLPPPLVCVQIVEPSDPDAWSDNYLCTQRDFGLKWSFAGKDPTLPFCTQINEPAEPAAQMWADNYLCSPVDYHLQWFIAGKPADPTLDCVQIVEPSDPDAWGDNYLCAPK